MKGPIALIDENMPVFVIATKGANYEKVVSNIQEVKARKGKITAVVTFGDKEVKAMADDLIEIPETDEFLVPLISVIPLQLLLDTFNGRFVDSFTHVISDYFELFLEIV